MTKELIAKIRVLEQYLTSSRPVSSSTVLEVYTQWCTETGKPSPRRKSSGCISCLRKYINEMVCSLPKESKKKKKTNAKKKNEKLSNEEHLTSQKEEVVK